jgi:hypothetical protein
MPIPFSTNTPLLANFGLYEIPATLAECVEQYRLDAVQLASTTLNVSDDVLELLTPHGSSFSDGFGPMFDPVACVGDTSLHRSPPGCEALLPPLPSTVVAEIEDLQPEMLLYAARLAKRFDQVSDLDVISLAQLVAVSFCENSGEARNRQGALRYVAANNASSPTAAMLRGHPSLWDGRRRKVDIPDMRAARKDDFVALFEQYGKPLQPHEIECVSDELLIRYASDMRAYILEQNRHIVFCRACSNRMLYFNARAMAPPSDTVM